MKLLELRLKNLNSLKGEWHIDFTDEAFVNEGIFAITGQTGAGKTTLLDALCLALYGKTPRIGSISKTTNEVMTRQTGECFSEVVIELDGTGYRCRWGQRRAYGKPNGNLQDATHEVAIVNSGEDKDKILEEKLSRTQSKIIDLLGMDFDQFTRSILLAQGSFSAFLTASGDERADILEKITGVDIYATISSRVHERKRLEEAKLSELSATLSGMTLLTEAEEAELITAQQQGQTELDQQEKRLSEVTEQLYWLERIKQLSTQINTHQQSLDRLEADWQTFSPDRQRLKQARQALELESDYAKLTHARQQATYTHAEIKKIEAELPKLDAQLTSLNEQQSTAKQNLSNAHTRLETSLPHIKQIRQIDIEISRTQHHLTNLQQRGLTDGIMMPSNIL